MRLNYKKAIILMMLSTMSMGVVCLSISSVKPGVNESIGLNVGIDNEKLDSSLEKDERKTITDRSETAFENIGTDAYAKAGSSTNVGSSTNATSSTNSNISTNTASSSWVIKKMNDNISGKIIDQPNMVNHTLRTIIFKSIVNVINQKALITPNFITYSFLSSSYLAPQLPVYALEEDGYPEINALMQVYYNAKICCDMDTLRRISTNPEAVISKENLLILTESIESYHNVKCYTKRTPIKGNYIVYAYHEIDFIGLDTFAPGLSKFYVVTDLDGTLKIYDGEMNKELKTYFDARNGDADVIALMDEIETMSIKAKEKDKDLKSFWAKLDN